MTFYIKYPIFSDDFHTIVVSFLSQSDTMVHSTYKEYTTLNLCPVSTMQPSHLKKVDNMDTYSVIFP